MNIKRIMLSIIALLGVSVFSMISAYATTYYVRDGGGAYGTTSTTCNGQSDVAFTGSNGPNCAVSSPGYILGWGCTQNNNNDCDYAPKMASGDKLYIDGDSDLALGSQAQYEIGYNPSTPGLFYNGTYGNCGSAGSPYNCQLGDVPAGVSGNLTSIIGTGTHKPQFWGTYGMYRILSVVGTGYYDIENLEITQHSSCSDVLLVHLGHNTALN